MTTTNKLASFRIDNQLWQQFQDIARENNTTATALLTGYIKSVVNTELEVINTDNTENIDNVNTTCEQLSIQDIDNRIKDAIAENYATIMNQFNVLVDQVHEIRSHQLPDSLGVDQESGVSSQESPINTEKLEPYRVATSITVNSTDIINDFSQWYTTQYKTGTQERKHKEIIKALKTVLKKYDIA